MGQTLSKKGGPNEKKRFNWVEKWKWHVGSSPIKLNRADEGQRSRDVFNPTCGESLNSKSEARCD